MKRMFAAILLIAIFMAGCSQEPQETVALRFSDAVELSKIKSLSGREVSIVGYMATLSPINGKYMYLMNLPYQSCPFCVPNTTQLSNTMAVFARNGQTFDYTDQAIRVTGKLETGDYSDDYGYTYSYRIVDARYETVDLSTVSEDYGLWQSIASDGIVPEVYAMLDYLSFVCQWPYYQYENDKGGVSYLSPWDVEALLVDAGVGGYAKFHQDNYFGKLIARAEAISKTGLSDLVEIIGAAEALEAYALNELSGFEYEYNEEDDIYTLNREAELADKYNGIYDQFLNWIAKWEL